MMGHVKNRKIFKIFLFVDYKKKARKPSNM